MQISVKRTGGFAGLEQQLGSVDEASAAGAKAAKLVGAMNFFSLPNRVASAQVGADQYQYEVTVEDGNRKHTVAFVGDDAMQGGTGHASASSDNETAPLAELVRAVTTV